MVKDNWELSAKGPTINDRGWVSIEKDSCSLQKYVAGSGKQSCTLKDCDGREPMACWPACSAVMAEGQSTQSCRHRTLRSMIEGGYNRKDSCLPQAYIAASGKQSSIMKD